MGPVGGVGEGASYNSPVRAERVIVLLKQFLGDGVMAEPLLTALAGTFSHVDVLAIPLVQQVLGDVAENVSFIHVEPMHNLRETMEHARKIRRKQYDIAFLVNRSFRSAVLARLAKIPIRIGHGTEGRSFLLTRSVTYRDEDFEAKSYADLARAARVPVHRLEPRLRVTDRERAEGRRLAQGATIAIQPGARHEYKRVATEHLAEVGNALIRQGHRLALVGGEEEAEAGAALARLLESPPVSLIGGTSIRQMLSVLTAVDLAMGSDTGVMHLAAGVGTPTVTAFGPTPSAKWGHHYPPHRVLIAPGGDLGLLDAKDLLRAAGAALKSG